MLTLNDGRNELWQWDTGRTLAVDADCSQVHFSNKVFGRSIDVDVVDGIAIIPDILLQTDKELTTWAFVGTAENGYTKISKVFKVNKRNKPADYVFTPPEQTTLQELVERLAAIEESQDPDAIKNAVDEYIANNPIQVKEKDPTVPDWAKQPTKPKYTADEVGAVATVNGQTPDENGNVEIEAGSGGGSVSDEQIAALDGMFQIAAYTENPVAKYNAFKTAFGLSGNDDSDKVPATSITLSASTLTFNSEESQTLTATVKPSNSTDAVVWKSSNNAIATVANGIVTPVSDGSCIITATAGSVSAQCAVTVAIEQEVITYIVNNYLTNVTNSNTATTVNSGSAYTATLTANEGYAINDDSVVISMNGTEITDAAYNAETGVISISAVTGDISITATGDVSTDWDFEWDYRMGLMSENGFTKTETDGNKGYGFAEELREDGVYIEAGQFNTMVMSPTGHETMESGAMEITFNLQNGGDANAQIWMSNGENGCILKMSNTQWNFCGQWAANKAYLNDYTIRIEFNKDGANNLYANAASDTPTKSSTATDTIAKTGIRLYHGTSMIVKSVKYKWSA